MREASFFSVTKTNKIDVRITLMKASTSSSNKNMEPYRIISYGRYLEVNLRASIVIILRDLEEGLQLHTVPVIMSQMIGKH